ncbi:unnamed protein product [Closterium sp. NIES-65]|nr:unnamed protein product [Closterium sp. NIES-65]
MPHAFPFILPPPAFFIPPIPSPPSHPTHPIPPIPSHPHPFPPIPSHPSLPTHPCPPIPGQSGTYTWETNSVRTRVSELNSVPLIACSKSGRSLSSSPPQHHHLKSDRTLKVWPLAALLSSSAAALPRGRGGVLRLKSGATVAAHDKDINAVAVAPNDGLVCSGSQDRTAKVWRLPDLSLSVTLRGHKRGVWSVAFSPVDRCVLTASGDATCRIWALADGSCLRTLQGHEASVLKAIFVTRGTQVVSTGADGLLKLWSVKGGECVNTFDEHEDKIWALAVSPGSEMLATGGSDSLVHVWQDCTQQEQQEAALEQVKAVQQEQAMRNAAVAEDYVTALQLALQLQRPTTMAALLSDLMKKEGAEERIGGAVAGLEPTQLRQLLLYAREWNTNAKLCLSAQRLLAAVLKHHPPATLMQIPGIGEILDGLQPYTQRHLARLERVLRSSYLVDYTLAALTMLQPTADLAVHADVALQPGAELALMDGKAALVLQAKAAAQERPSGLEVLKEKVRRESERRERGERGRGEEGKGDGSEKGGGEYSEVDAAMKMWRYLESKREEELKGKEGKGEGEEEEREDGEEELEEGEEDLEEGEEEREDGEENGEVEGSEEDEEEGGEEEGEEAGEEESEEEIEEEEEEGEEGEEEGEEGEEEGEEGEEEGEEGEEEGEEGEEEGEEGEEEGEEGEEEDAGEEAEEEAEGTGEEEESESEEEEEEEHRGRQARVQALVHKGKKGVEKQMSAAHKGPAAQKRVSKSKAQTAGHAVPSKKQRMR